MGAQPVFDGARMFAQIARELAETDDFASTTQRVVQMARTVLDCDSSAVWSLTDQDTVRLHAATDPELAEQYSKLIGSVREGIAWECLRSNATIRVQDIRDDHRWPVYRAAVLKSSEPFLSAVGYSLGHADNRVGALIVASRKPQHFTDALVELGAIYAEHAAIGIESANAEQRARNLEQALQSNRRIGMAIGIVMMEYRIQEGPAFDMLRAVSQHTHRKLREVAEDVILTGALPSWPQRDLAHVGH